MHPFVPRPRGKTIFGFQRTSDRSPFTGTASDRNTSARPGVGLLSRRIRPPMNRAVSTGPSMPARLISRGKIPFRLLTPSGIETLRLSLESMLSKRVWKFFRRTCPSLYGANAASLQQARKSSFTLIRRFLRRKILLTTGPNWYRRLRLRSGR